LAIKSKKKRNFYIAASAACLLGYGWLAFVSSHSGQSDFPNIKICIFRTVTGIPCPSCGTSRAIIQLSQGDLWGSFLMNPFGYIVAAGLLVLPFWLIFDLITKKSSLFDAIKPANRFFSNRIVIVLGIALVLANWAWNLYKYYL